MVFYLFSGCFSSEIPRDGLALWDNILKPTEAKIPLASKFELFSQPFYPSPAKFQHAKILSEKSQKRKWGDLAHFMGKFVVEIIICSPFNYLKAHFTKQMDKHLKPHKRTTLRKSWNSNDLTLLSLFLRFKFFFLVKNSTISETK